MFVVTHFSIPFFSYFTVNRYLKSNDDKKSLLIHSSIVGLTGITPDLISFHISLVARHNSIVHTVLSPLMTLCVCAVLVLLFKKIPRSFVFWLPFSILTHLFLDGLSIGIKLLYPSPLIVGDYYISPAWWGISDTCFLSLLYLLYKINHRNPLQKAEQYL